MSDFTELAEANEEIGRLREALQGVHERTVHSDSGQWSVRSIEETAESVYSVEELAEQVRDLKQAVRELKEIRGRLGGSLVHQWRAEQGALREVQLLQAAAPRLIITADELDALKFDAVVVDSDGYPRTWNHGWSYMGNSPITSAQLADGRPMAVVYDGIHNPALDAAQETTLHVNASTDEKEI